MTRATLLKLFVILKGLPNEHVYAYLWSFSPKISQLLAYKCIHTLLHQPHTP